ncbi:MarR family winged helix-turn-helix transcriptional regulator [Levilactobacillus parabrevis]|uniref:Transcriptional regulator, MarR family n=1 Tax=Levilactobacillus parabrevis ATCC 53295 TaxID=1267003 RepID=A0A0R1GTP1_9LACO|nr:MarR family transcriptional regulator [Levilactobacillus parabrevis]KRK37660.1 transcriptional regulator, MarR family [Levilactobacillus parabrevis ATCC 53295]KRO06577.1 transcriptional regulator, MarR family [Levilactobacillus parabrevis]
MAEVLRPIGTVARALDSISNIEFKALDLNRGQYLYLVRVAETPGIILERLAVIVRVDKTTAARAIQKLEKNGILERRPSPTDKKQKQIFLTSKGQALYPIIKRENAYSNATALKGFTPAERDQLADYLKRVEANINSDWFKVKHGEHRNY